VQGERTLDFLTRPQKVFETISTPFWWRVQHVKIDVLPAWQLNFEDLGGSGNHKFGKGFVEGLKSPVCAHPALTLRSLCAHSGLTLVLLWSYSGLTLVLLCFFNPFQCPVSVPFWWWAQHVKIDVLPARQRKFEDLGGSGNHKFGKVLWKKGLGALWCSFGALLVLFWCRLEARVRPE